MYLKAILVFARIAYSITKNNDSKFTQLETKKKRQRNLPLLSYNIRLKKDANCGIIRYQNSGRKLCLPTHTYQKENLA